MPCFPVFVRLLITSSALLAAVSFVSSASFLGRRTPVHVAFVQFQASPRHAPNVHVHVDIVRSGRSPTEANGKRAASPDAPPTRGHRPSSSLRATSLESIAPRILARSTLPSVALILPSGVRNATARGSGFVVDFPFDRDDDASLRRRDIYLLTAAHVAMPGYRIQVVFFPEIHRDDDDDDDEKDDENDWNRESVSMSATVVGRNVPSDLALLRVHIAEDAGFVPPPPLVLSTKRKAALGTPAYAVGYPSGGVVGPAVTCGIVCGNAAGLVTGSSAGRASEGTWKNETSSTNGGLPDDGTDNAVNRDFDKKTRYIVTDAAMAGGMSGGPLVDGSSGSVLGVNALINMELRALGNYAVSASECSDFLNRISLRWNGVADGQKENHEKPTVYRVMLYNDRFNKRDRVQHLLQNTAQLNATESNRIMMEAHTNGRGLIREFYGDDAHANELCDALRNEDLLVEVEAMY